MRMRGTSDADVRFTASELRRAGLKAILLDIHLLPLAPAAGQAQERRVRPSERREVYRDVSQPLRTIKPLPPPLGPPYEMRELEVPHSYAAEQTDPVRQSAGTPLVATSSGLNFIGLGIGFPSGYS